jgi:signal peptidase I
VHDHVVVLKIAYGLRAPFLPQTLVQWSVPKRGDIVVFKRTEQEKRTMVKRVVGVAGDAVSISDGGVSVNGTWMAEPYAHASGRVTGQQQSFTVPPGSVFLLGDNRDESYDSRFWKEPFVRTENVLGPVALVY